MKKKTYRAILLEKNFLRYLKLIADQIVFIIFFSININTIKLLQTVKFSTFYRLQFVRLIDAQIEKFGLTQENHLSMNTANVLS